MAPQNWNPLEPLPHFEGECLGFQAAQSSHVCRASRATLKPQGLWARRQLFCVHMTSSSRGCFFKACATILGEVWPCWCLQGVRNYIAPGRKASGPRGVHTAKASNPPSPRNGLGMEWQRIVSAANPNSIKQFNCHQTSVTPLSALMGILGNSNTKR